MLWVPQRGHRDCIGNVIAPQSLALATEQLRIIGRPSEHVRDRILHQCPSTVGLTGITLAQVGTNTLKILSANSQIPQRPSERHSAIRRPGRREGGDSQVDSQLQLRVQRLVGLRRLLSQLIDVRRPTSPPMNASEGKRFRPFPRRSAESDSGLTNPNEVAMDISKGPITLAVLSPDRDVAESRLHPRSREPRE